MGYEYDRFGSIVNGEGTYRAVVENLVDGYPVVLDWTDGEGTLYNVLIAFNPLRPGIPGGLVDGSGKKIWIGIAGRGCFGFGQYGRGGYVDPSYAGEKLGLESAVDATGIAELITGIRVALAEEMAR